MIPSITPDPPGAMGEAGGAVGHVARPAGSMLGYHVDRPGPPIAHSPPTPTEHDSVTRVR